MITVPVRIGRAFLARPYRSRDMTLSHEGGWWVCTIDDTTHAAHNALSALKGWFMVWDHHSHGQCHRQAAHSCPFAKEIHNNHDKQYCRCCERCTNECRRDV